jgi:transposase
MLIFSRSLRLCLAAQPIDLRKSFEGLAAIITHDLKEDPRSHHIYAFTNKRRDRLRLLYWDGSGMWVMTKRLEQGTFAWPTQPQLPQASAPPEDQSGGAARTEQTTPDRTTGAPRIYIKPEAFEMLVSGLDLKGVTLRRWYESQ